MSKRKLLCTATFLSTFAAEVPLLANAKEVIPVAPTALLVKKVLKKKYQKINGPCWAFATLATLEVALSKKGIVQNSLSEKHLLNWSNRLDEEEGWHIKIKDGSSFNTSKGYLISGSGPIYESAKQYNIKDQTYNASDSCVLPVYSVKGIKDIESDNIDSIKNAISEYGAVSAIYNTDGKNNNHAISVIGWDDETKEWIVKDSSDNSKESYKRLSYSFKLKDCFTFTDVKLYNQKEKIYQYDQFGTTGRFESSSLTICNVYNFNGNEKLKEITLGTNSAGCNYSIYYTSSFTEKGPSENQKDWVRLKSGTVPFNGYFTSNLDRELKLNKEKGAIIVKIEKSQASNSSPTIRIVNSDKKLKSKEKRNQCYILRNKKFIDVMDDGTLKKFNSMFSIKAITEKLN